MAVGDQSLPALITIGVSHYCEKVRWALQRYGIQYVEEVHVPGAHRPAAKAAGGAGAVPCLRLPGGPAGRGGDSDSSVRPRCVDESTPILRWVDAEAAAAAVASGMPPPPPLFPPGEQGVEVARLCGKFDKELGPATRLWAYSHLLYTGTILRAIIAPPVPAAERAALRYGGWLLLRLAMAKGMGINRKNGLAALQRVRQIFDEVGALLADGRPYLAGAAFTAADLCFAALAAPAVGQAYAAAPGAEGELPAEMRQDMEGLRACPAGRFALRLWTEQRGVVLGGGDLKAGGHSGGTHSHSTL